MEARSIEVLTEPVPLDSRVPTGIEGLDPLIEGGFPPNSLILLAGQPGAGKTIFGMQFLCKGAEDYGENGVYVSFAESADVLARNVSRHLGCDLRKAAEGCGKVKILDFVTVKEKGISTILELVLEKVKSLNAKRLVIDSFSALAQAFEDKIEARIIVHTVLGKIVRQLGCTTILIVEVPTGREDVGMGVEEFVADGVLMLRKEFSPKLDGRLVREIEISKMRGTELRQPLHFFTLKKGFKVFPPFELKPIEKKRKFQAIADSKTHFSTGSRELDEAFRGGYPRGSLILYEIADNISTLEWELLLCPTMANFMAQGRGGTILPAGGHDADLTAKAVMDLYGFTQEEVNSLLRVQEPRINHDPDKPYRALIEGKNAEEDIEKLMDCVKVLKDKTGKPAIYYISLDTAETLWGAEAARKIGSMAAIRVKKERDIVIKLTDPKLKSINQKFVSLSDLHLKLVKEHGALLLYGLKPRTGLYVVEMDASAGYPLPKLTPIV